MRLQQVLINLAGNAIKFTETGEVVISVAVVGHTAEGVTMDIAVRDTGIGISPENQQRIFSGFTQAEASTTRRFGGTGLGLAISQRLVGMMGGELLLDSALGSGSRFHFRITLPVAPSLAPESTARPGDAQALRVLVVDDNPTACEVLQRMGLSMGWLVDTAASGEQALELLQRQQADGLAYQAVFVDWQMPGLDGWETSPRIQAMSEAGTAPVVVMVTAHDREQLAQKSPAEQALLNGFLVKPVTASMLFDAIADARGTRAMSSLVRPDGASGHRRLQGLSLLLVEDNLNNQQVARELLQEEGADIVIANHGGEAVQLLGDGHSKFDAVLMDMQMPVMDGLAATRHIRGELGLNDLPIIAMTANAMAADREASLQAGMNDHVGKPFDLDQLVATLLRHTARQGMIGAGKPAARSATTDELPMALLGVAGAAGVELPLALRRIGGKTDVYERLLRCFVRDIEHLPGQLRAHLAQADTEATGRVLHDVKGLAGTLAIPALASAAEQAEQVFLAGSASAVRAAEHIDALCHTVTAIRPLLMDLLSALQPAGKAQETSLGAVDAADPQILLAALGPLAALLRDCDMAATDAMSALKSDLHGRFRDSLQPMDDAISELDFDRALHLCEELMETTQP